MSPTITTWTPDMGADLAPGLYADVPFEVYAALPGENWSGLKELHKSAKRYRWRKSQPRQDTHGLRGLRLVHTLVLEPERWPLDYYVASANMNSVNAALERLQDGWKVDALGIKARGACGLPVPKNIVHDARSNSKEYKGLVEQGYTVIKSKAWAEALKKWDEVRADVHSERQGLTRITPAQEEESRATAAAVLAYPPASHLLNHPGAHTEVTCVWVDEKTGVRCKGRFDLLVIDVRVTFDGEGLHIEDAPGVVTLIDLKTVRRLKGLEYDTADHGYHGQVAGHYARGAVATLGCTEVVCGILAVEGSDERDCTLAILTDDDVYAGEQWRDGLLEKLVECRKNNDWPGQYPNGRALGLSNKAPGMPENPTDDIDFDHMESTDG